MQQPTTATNEHLKTSLYSMCHNEMIFFLCSCACKKVRWRETRCIVSFKKKTNNDINCIVFSLVCLLWLFGFLFWKLLVNTSSAILNSLKDLLNLLLDLYVWFFFVCIPFENGFSFFAVVPGLLY